MSCNSRRFSKISYPRTPTLSHTTPRGVLPAVPLGSSSSVFSYLLTLARRVPVRYRLRSAYKNSASGFDKRPGHCGPNPISFLLCAFDRLSDNLASLLSRSRLSDIRFSMFVLAFAFAAAFAFAIVSRHHYRLSPME